MKVFFIFFCQEFTLGYKCKAFFLYFIIFSMDFQYQLLAKRDKKQEVFNMGMKRKFMTNFFSVGIDQKKSMLYQFVFKLPEEIPHDSMFYDKSIRSIKNILKEEFGYICHKGQMFWGTKPCEVPTIKKCSFCYGGTDFNFEGFIAQTRAMIIKDLWELESKDQILQILNVELKNMLRGAGLIELGKKGEYFPKKQQSQNKEEMIKIGLNVERGYRFTLVPLLKGISLQVDVCSSVTQIMNFRETIEGMKEEEIIREYTGSIVHTNYGAKKRTYRIEEIDFKMNPSNEFHNSKKGCPMSYEEYYRENYGIKVTSSKKGPLLKVVGRVEQILKNGKLEKIPEYIYLIPEFVSLTGLTSQQRGTAQAMKALGPYTKVSPKDRVKESQAIVSKLKGSDGLLCIKQSESVEGLVLPRPIVMYSAAQNPSQQGLMKNRGKLQNAYNFKEWMAVFSENPRSRDEENITESIQILKKAGEAYGIKFASPQYLTMSGSVNDWMEGLKMDVDTHGMPEMLVFFLKDSQEKYYGPLKNFCVNVLKCPNQFIKIRTLKNPKGALSAASKIGIQMNIKMGATPWTVEKKHDYFKRRNIMYGALSLSKGKKGFTLAFVGTISNDCAQIFSDVKMEIEKKEEIPPSMLEELFVTWAKNYFQTNGRKVPETIILYREGLSDAQIEDQIPRTELPALHGMITKIAEKTKTPNYKPEIVIVVVNKKINSKIYSMDQNSINNPVSGSVVTDCLSTNGTYSFHMVPQQVTQGTSTPTLYKVVHDTSKMPKQALVNFTFEQCFNYYNWEGAVRVPACLQSANKMAKLFGESIQNKFEPSILNKQHFFL